MTKTDGATHPARWAPLSERGWRGSGLDAESFDISAYKGMDCVAIPSRRGVPEGRGVSHSQSQADNKCRCVALAIQCRCVAFAIQCRFVSHSQSNAGVSHSQSQAVFLIETQTAGSVLAVFCRPKASAGAFCLRHNSLLHIYHLLIIFY